MVQDERRYVELCTHEKSKTLRFEKIGYYPDGSGYHCDLVVDSVGFCLRRSFNFSEWGLKEFLASLDNMQKNLTGAAVLKEDYEPHYVKLEVEPKQGHVTITGEVWEFGADQHLKFCFTTDQTCLKPLNEGFTRLGELKVEDKRDSSCQ
jgi:hypothetical protein